MQPIITSLKEQKYRDIKEFQTAFTAFQEDKKKTFDEIEEFVKSIPFLENRFSSDLFSKNTPDQFVFYEPFVQLDIRRFNEDLQQLIGVLVDYGYRDFANKIYGNRTFSPSGNCYI